MRMVKRNGKWWIFGTKGWARGQHFQTKEIARIAMKIIEEGGSFKDFDDAANPFRTYAVYRAAITCERPDLVTWARRKLRRLGIRLPQNGTHQPRFVREYAAAFSAALHASS